MARQKMIPASELLDRLSRVRVQLTALRTEERLLEDLLRGVDGVPAKPVDARGSGRGDVRAAIIAFLRENPGETAQNIAFALESVVTSRARDRKAVLRTTAARLASEGVLERREGGGLHVVEKGGGG